MLLDLAIVNYHCALVTKIRGRTRNLYFFIHSIIHS